MKKLSMIGVMGFTFLLSGPGWPAETDHLSPAAQARLDMVQEALDREQIYRESAADPQDAADEWSSPVVSPREDNPADVLLGRSRTAVDSVSTAEPTRDEIVDDALNQIEMGLEAYSYTYKEPGLMKDSGALMGVSAAYTQRFLFSRDIESWQDALDEDRKINVVRLEGRAAWGEVDYESYETGSLDGINYFSSELRALLGYEIPLNPDLRVMPYLGYGYRYLKDDQGGKLTSTGAWTYDRESQYQYIPIGVELTRDLSNRWTVALTLEYDLFLAGRQKSHMEDGGLTLYDSAEGTWHVQDTLENNQNKGYGARGSVKVTRQSDWMDFFLEPYVRYWSIGESEMSQYSSEGGLNVWVYSGTDVPVTGYEPKNTTMEYGLKAGVIY